MERLARTQLKSGTISKGRLVEEVESLQQEVKRWQQEAPPITHGGPDLMTLWRNFKNLRNRVFPDLIHRLLRSGPAPDDQADLELYRLLSRHLFVQDALPEPEGPKWGDRLDKVKREIRSELQKIGYPAPADEVLRDLTTLIDVTLKFVASASKASAHLRFPDEGDVFDPERHEPEVRNSPREGRIREVLFPMLLRDDGRAVERAWVILGPE